METQEQIDKWLDEMIEETERDIDIVFAKRTKAILDHIAYMYRKYGEGKELSRTELYKYNRYEKEMKFIAESINEHYKELYKDIQKLLQTQYVENMLRSGFLYEFETQQNMQYVIPSLTTINQAVLNPIKELTLSALLNNHRNDTIRKINIEIGQSLQAGEGYRQLADRLQKALGFSKVKAQRVARTEAHRVQSTSRIDSAKHASKYVEMKKMWDATLGDGRVRKSHRKLDGKVVDFDGIFHGDHGKGPAPGLMSHPADQINCRCAVVFLPDGVKPKLRRARLKDGKTAVVPYTTYEEWAKKLPKE